MIRFPNAKINIGLSVVKKRPDGYHNIETIFYPVTIEDALEIVPSPNGHVQLHLSGITLHDGSSENLVIKAYQLLKDQFQLPPLHFHLHKNIPFGAGLGGGSSDAAYTLNMLNDMFSLNISVEDRQLLATKLGADCSFFIKNQPVFATGTGNVFQKITLDLRNYWILLVKPPCMVNTKEAYNGINPKKALYFLPEVVKQPVSEWKNMIFNDFEKVIFKKYPIIESVKSSLYKHGALYAAMSGSGSSVYGIFDKHPDIIFPDNYKIFTLN